MFKLRVFNTVTNNYYETNCKQLILKKNNDFLIINEEAVKRSTVIKTYSYCVVECFNKKTIFKQKIMLYMCNKTNYISIFIVKK